MNYDAWKNTRLGQHIDIDGWYGAQCVDVIMDYAQYLFPGEGWPDLIGVTDSAKNIYGTANDQYFLKLQGIRPVQGDIVVYGATQSNADGHIAVVDHADANTITTVEQNGFNPAGVTYIEVRNYNNIVGFLRPKGGAMFDESNARYWLKYFVGISDPNQNDIEFAKQYMARADAVGYLDQGVVHHPAFVPAFELKDRIKSLEDQLAHASGGGIDQQTKDDIGFIRATVQWIKDKLSSVFK